jgi:hypothetical protein
MTHRSIRINVIAHQGCAGMNKKLVIAWTLTMTMPSHRAYAAAENMPKPAARTIRLTISSHQPHVDAPVLIQ